MSNIHTNLNSLFTNIANIIRTKTNKTATIIANDFPSEIRKIRTGFDYNNQNVTAIPDYAFYGCEDLNNVDCYNITSIGANAFENCTNLKTITLYDGVTNIGENAFKGCSNAVIYCMFENKPDGWHENWNPDGCEVIWLGGAIETWDISATEEDNVIAKLYNNGIYDDMYTLIVSGNGNMKEYLPGYYTPWHSYKSLIKSIIILFEVTSTGVSTFNNCSNLTKLIIPDSVTSIGNYAFSYCSSLTSVTIPNSVTIIDQAFNDCINLSNITLGNSVAIIGERAFYCCKSLTSIIIPDSVTSIGDRAFYHCESLVNVIIPDSVTSIGNEAFYGCSSVDYNIYDNVRYLGNTENPYFALISTSNSYITSCKIHEDTKIIAGCAFDYCENLVSIVIPNGVTTICKNAFKYCTSLTSINYDGTVAQWNAITFGSGWKYNTGNYTIHCTDGDIAKDGTTTYHTS
jgi:hypothetical protein